MCNLLSDANTLDRQEVRLKESFQGAMELIYKYKELILSLESRFLGLPHTHTTLIKSLINRMDIQTGIVEGICYLDLIDLLTVNPAPGRKGAGSPTKESIRNYIKTIERECGDYFKVITEGQKLKFLFPELPLLFKKYFPEESNTDIPTCEPFDLHEENGNDDIEINTEFSTEANTASDAVKNNNINKTKQNKLTGQGKKGGKKAIDDNFYPSQETIQTALALGLTRVLNQDEISRFIDYNLSNNTQWEDFNPIFITWLKREREYNQQKQRKQQLSQGKSRSRVNEYPNSYEAALAAVMQANADACPPSASYTFEAYEDKPVSFEHLMAVAATHRPVWPVIY